MKKQKTLSLLFKLRLFVFRHLNGMQPVVAHGFFGGFQVLVFQGLDDVFVIFYGILLFAGQVKIRIVYKLQPLNMAA